MHLRIMLRKCAACGADNRVPVSHLSDTGRCGSCRSPLAPVSAPIDATAKLFHEIVQAAKVPVLVDFWAEWCGPCKMAAPEVAAVASEMAGRLTSLKWIPNVSGTLPLSSASKAFLTSSFSAALKLPSSAAMPRDELRRWVESIPPA